MKKIIPAFKRSHFYVLGLPLFFIFHQFSAVYPLCYIDTLVFTLFVHLIVFLVFAFLAYLYFKNKGKAILFTFLLMLLNLSYGYIIDAIRAIDLPSFFHKTIFVLPLLILISFLIGKKIAASKIAHKSIGFLNVLFLVLILTDIFLFGIKLKSSITSQTISPHTTPVANENDPDVYFIILDGYAGKIQCENGLHFNNQKFFDTLSQLGFHHIDSTESNYNYTPYSTASTLNMQYLNLPKNATVANGSRTALQLIKQNAITDFFAEKNYNIYNHSIFNIRNLPAQTGSSFLTSNVNLLMSYSLISRLEKEVLLPFSLKYKFNWYLEKKYFIDKKNNENFIGLTEKIAAQKLENPKFVYTHLMMPHHPFYYDSVGNLRSLTEIINTPLTDKDAYVSYMKYTNRVIYKFVENIVRTASRPPLIILCSDHGYRDDHGSDPSLQFSNIISILTPAKNYTLYPKRITNVNLFRTLLNREFNQKIPLLMDSTFYIDF
ncbi:MAG: hypothetical protein RL115_1482 [Bacteroidota bacterium]|jgi:hypothetical protein